MTDQPTNGWCCSPTCRNPAELPHRLMSISVDPLSATSRYAGVPVGVVPVPMCGEHKRRYYHELRAGSDRLVGRMMLVSSLGQPTDDP